MTDLVSYRAASSQDIPQLAALGRELFIETWGTLYSSQDLNSFLEQVHSPEGVACDLAEDCCYWIAQSSAQWIAYCKAGPVHVPVDIGGRRAAELRQMYVRQPYHGTGVADQLMELFLQWTSQHQIQDAYISCWSENHRALAFYKRYGFSKFCQYKFRVGQQLDDEYILKRVLVA